MRIVILAAALMLGIAPAWAAKKAVPKPPALPTCKLTEAHAMLKLRGMVDTDPAKIELFIYTGARATRLIATLNAEPPETHYVAEKLLVLTHKGSERVFVFAVVHGCADTILGVPLDGWNSIRRAALGDDT